MSIFNSLQNQNDLLHVDTKRSGISLGRVSDLKDPDGLNRVKCTFLLDDPDVEATTWAYIASPFAGNESGMFFHPNKGDIVVIAYDEGDIHTPIIIGSLWYSSGDKAIKSPVTINKDEPKNFMHEIRTPKKNSFILSDEDGKEKISLTTPKGRSVLLDDEKELIQLSDKEGKNFISIDSKKDEITIKCGKKLSIQVGTSAKIEIDGTGGKIDMEGKQSISLKTAQLKAEASGTAVIKSNGQLSLESSGITIVKGSMVKIN